MIQKNKVSKNSPGKKPPHQPNYRVLILTFVLIGVVGYALGKYPDLFFGSPQQTFKKANLRLSPDVLAVPPQEMEAALTASYRLKPDNRFLLAVSKVSQLITGKTGKVEVQFENRQWTILHDGEVVGKVPEVPDFPDFLKVLKSWSRLLDERNPAFLTEGRAMDPGARENFQKALESFEPDKVLHQLQALDIQQKDGIRKADLLAPAAKAWSVLAFNHLDTLEVADDVPAQALAVLAVAQAHTDERLIKEEARLAEMMQYTTHARKRVRQLKVTDPLRQYVLQDTPALKSLAVKRTSDWETRYLFLLRLAKSKDDSVWEKWYDEGFPMEYEDTLALFKTGLILDSFSVNNYYAQTVRQLIFESLKAETEEPESSNPISEFFSEILSLSQTAQFINSFQEISGQALEVEELESELSGLNGYYSGPFLDSETCQSFFRGLFYSTLHTNGRQVLDRLSSVQDAEQFLQATGTSEMEGSGHFQLGSDFYQWFSFLIQVEKRNIKPGQVLEALGGMPTFKGEPIYKVYDEARGLIPSDSPVKRRAMRRVAARLDTRISHRDHMRWLALDELYDPGMSEQLAASVYKTAKDLYPYQQSWYLMFVGDSKALLKNLRSGKGSVKSRVWILGFLEQIETLKEGTLIREYRKLVKKEPENWLVRQPFVKFLMRKKRFREARKISREWLELDVEVTGLEKIAAQNFVAESLYEEKKYSEAHEEISKVAQSYQGKSLRLAGQINEKLGDLKKAERIFRKAIQRYPGSYKQTQALVNLYWTQKRYNDALSLIKNFPGGLNTQNWRSDVAIGFYQTFKDRSEEEAISTFDSLLKAGISPSYLSYIPGTLFKGNFPRLAFKLQTRLKGKKSQQLFFDVKSYDFLKAWKGKRAALKWLEARDPGRFGFHSANVFFERKKFSMLWTLIPPDPAPQVWLLRAAASLRSKPTAAQRRQLNKYFRKNDPADTRNQMGRYLLGKISEEELLRQADDPVKRLEFAFYIGWKARAQGDWYKAARWFRIALETDQKRHWEYGWAGKFLFKWKEKGFALSYLKRHPKIL